MVGVQYREQDISRHLAIFDLTIEALAALICENGFKNLRFEGFPKDAMILGASFDDRANILHIKCEHPSFPLANPGEMILSRKITVTEKINRRRIKK